MKNKTLSFVLRTSLICLLVAAIMVGFIGAPVAQVSGYQASYIDRLENAPSLNLKDYLDSSVMFKLPENVKDDQEISVIITVDTINLMDAYDSSNKTMSFKDFALNSKEAEKINAQIAAQKAEILAKLDEQKIAYTLGDDYSTILSGFELEILARDFNATCRSLKKGQGIIVSEEYKKADAKLVENDVFVYGTGIFDSSKSPYDGSGMVVAVLDTGLDSAHSA